MELVMRLTIVASTILLILSAVLLAQVSPEEAQQRMLDRIAQDKLQAQQDAIAATQPSILTNGEVAALRKTIAQQQNQIKKLTDEVQQLKDKLAASQQNLHNAQVAANAPANESSDSAAGAAIDKAIAQHTLAIGMTIQQASQATGAHFVETESGPNGTIYVGAADVKQAPKHLYIHGVLMAVGNWESMHMHDDASQRMACRGSWSARNRDSI
jgi:uncharacterized coiled-coil protein SlyX